jgi:N,N'-diacetyllegionaminate synthase
MKKVLIIAEAGVNHNGSIEIAKKMIDVASEAKADIIKFQTFKADKLVSRSAKMAEYQIKNINDNSLNNSQFEMLKKLELNEESHNVLKEYCQNKGIEFLSTSFDEESIDLLKKIKITTWKIPSGEITNKPLLQKIGSFNEMVILSTGMALMKEIEDAISILVQSGTLKNNITVLHCNTEYPTPMKDVNLKAMIEIREKLNVKVGYSDHTLGIEIPIAAVALGAEVIEKHFTLDRKMEGPDHRASLEPEELKQMVESIRNIEIALGSGIKEPSNSELKNMVIARKSIHLKKNKMKDDILNLDDLIMKRPGDGISPMQYEDLIGKKVKFDLKVDHKITINDFE